MNKEFIPYELALELKQLKFDDEECFGRFYTKPRCKMFSVDENGRHYLIKNIPKKLYTLGEHFVLNDGNVIIVPTYSQAFRWFREKYDLNNFIYHYAEDDILHIINFAYNINNNIFESDFKLYEEAELACLRKLIEIVKGGNK
jgi:hypothetical protein